MLNNKIIKICKENKNTNSKKPCTLVSFDDEIDIELERRSLIQYNDDDDDEPHWDEGKLFWARKMFRAGANWGNER